MSRAEAGLGLDKASEARAQEKGKRQVEASVCSCGHAPREGEGRGRKAQSEPSAKPQGQHLGPARPLTVGPGTALPRGGLSVGSFPLDPLALFYGFVPKMPSPLPAFCFSLMSVLACAGLSLHPSPQVPDCCPGFFGTLCEPCPGGLGGVCSGRGQCQDRLLGSGECRCHEGFHGTACEMCELGRYGANCTGGEDRGGGRSGRSPGRRQQSRRYCSRGRTESAGNSRPPLSTPSVCLCPRAVPGGAARGRKLCL